MLIFDSFPSYQPENSRSQRPANLQSEYLHEDTQVGAAHGNHNLLEVSRMVVTTGKKGVWEPLPLIYYGYAVHPLSQSRRDTRRDTRCSNRTRLSTFTDVSGTTDDHLTHRDVVTLEVGDEVYAFEKYTPKAKEVEGIWYRG